MFIYLIDYQTIKYINNLIQDYEKILTELHKNCSHIQNRHQIRRPKLSDIELVALNLTAEYMSINSELQLFRCIKGSVLEDRIERSVYNKRKRNLFGYKLHAVCDKNGVIHSFDFTPANVHDVNYLKDVKYNLKNCTLIGDRGYISADYQQDLFNQSEIKLSVPMRKNQQDFVHFSKTKRKIRKRIETVISQLAGQFLMGVNYAKTFQGLTTRILSKITSFTMIQYLNFFVFKRSLGKTKINLC